MEGKQQLEVGRKEDKIVMLRETYITLFHAVLISNTAKQLFIDRRCNGKESCEERESAAGSAGSLFEEGVASTNHVSAPWGYQRLCWGSL